ncbi:MULTISPECIES: ATP-binding protein [Providencia]|uniref:nSTAND3 domain-containing NTPase n=1 Tax=Providencia TaxID=586 RepID=UPI002349C94B|nr:MULTISPECIES: ATP-binding protein [Providencia]
MNNYDFTRLNDKEFEDLVIDLISAENPNTQIERFMPGRDSGMDGRFYIDSNNVIIQSKHYVKSSYSSLINSLKLEAPKVTTLNPSRYILAICQGLTNIRKDEIIEIFGSQYLRSDDILSLDDITHKLSQNKDIERKYYKLWLNSTEVLFSLLHNDVIGKSNHILQQIKSNVDNYVQTRDFDIAKNKLDKINTLIITGAPGVGKTTLAEQLCLHYILDEYELIYIESDIEEGEKLILPNKKQLFLYDDFLGRNYLDALRNKEDSKIVRFINRIIKNNEKKLILTSRTTILNQGKLSSELFYINNTEKHEYEVEVKNLAVLDKAKILYNHIWFSNLPQEYKNCFWVDKKYRQIISHKNYNPRLISFITDYDKVSHLSSEKYWDYIIESLNNPSAIWDYMLTKQVPKCVYYLTYLVSLNNGSISENTLSQCYNMFLDMIDFDFKHSDYLLFHDCTKHAVKSTLQRKLEDGKEPSYDVLNPSISDYFIETLDNNLPLIPLIFSALTTRQSLLNLDTLINKKMSPFLSSKIVNAILENIEDNKDESYILEFINIIISSDKISLIDKLKSVKIINPEYLKQTEFYAGNNFKILEIINWGSLNAQDYFGYDNIKDYITVSLLENGTDLIYEELNILAQISNTLGETALSNNIHDLLLDYWQNYVQEFISESNDFTEYYSLNDEDSLKSRAKDCISELLAESTLSFTASEVDDIITNLDANNIIERNIENEAPDWERDEYDRHYINQDDGFDAVDDLFSIN